MNTCIAQNAPDIKAAYSVLYDPHFAPENQTSSEYLLSLGFDPIVAPGIDEGLVFIPGTNFGYSVGIDLEPKCSSPDNSVPRQEMIDFATELGVNNSELFTLYPFRHGDKAYIVQGVNGDSVYLADEGRSVAYDAKNEDPHIDGALVPSNEVTDSWAMSGTGADCATVGIEASTVAGKRVRALIHAGTKGSLTGIVENTIAKLFDTYDIKQSSMQVLVGAAIQAIEFPVNTLNDYISQNSNNDLGKNVIELMSAGSVLAITTDNNIDNPIERAVYNNQLDVALRLKLAIDESYLKRPIMVLNVNTLVDDRFKSYRGGQIAKRAGNVAVVGLNTGRNMTFIMPITQALTHT